MFIQLSVGPSVYMCLLIQFFRKLIYGDNFSVTFLDACTGICLRPLSIKVSRTVVVHVDEIMCCDARVANELCIFN